MADISPANKALVLIPKRAESRQAVELHATFVDSGIAISLQSVDHQIVYGRRGTGKTHALRYLETVVAKNGEVGIYVDLRRIVAPRAPRGVDM